MNRFMISNRQKPPYYIPKEPKMTVEEYNEIMDQAYKEPDYLSPHDLDDRLDDHGGFIHKEDEPDDWN